ncbi:MAG TPA: DUF11 domain-containing protein, partial [Ilumatobacteraceae bacterium]|nr:DUF11 domain-containing protein [Ilumatobacteraceae bacterium]
VVVIDVVVQVDATASGLLRNTATARSATIDPQPGNDSASVDAVIGFAADIRLTKTVTTSPVVAGLPVTFRLTATNAGPSPATNVAITDTLPAGLTFRSSAPAGCTAVDQTVSCPVGDLAPTISATFDIVADVDPAAVGATSNTAEVTADTPDPDTSDPSNRPTAPFTVTAVADLTVTKVANTDPVVPGLTASWRITVSNAGPSVAARATVDDPLPTGATATTGTDARCTGTTALACAVGDLVVGASTTLDVVASIAPGAVGNLINTATASSSASDPTAASSSATVALAAQVNRSVRITPRSTSVVAGDPITVDIAVGNVGPSDSAATVVRIPVPAGVTFTSGDPRCALQGAEVVCTIGVVAPGATVDLAVVFAAEPNRTSPVAFTATVSGAGADSDASNDTSSASVATTPRAITLAVRGECRNDVPWLVHTVTGNFAFTSVTLRLAGVDVVTRETRVVGPTGAQLWPGATADAAGNGTDWPGWVFEDGQWVQADDGFTWVRPTMQVTAEVNPTVTTTVDYPTGCADPVQLALPSTGGDSQSPVQIAVALLVAGLALVLIAGRRRRAPTP